MFTNLKLRLLSLFTRVHILAHTFYKNLKKGISHYPFRSFFITLGLLFVTIVVGHLLQSTPATKTEQSPIKKVQVYSIGESAKATFEAKIEKAGILHIYAQTNGIVQKSWVTEGQQVNQGQQLLTLSSTYQGGNAPALQRQLAQTQYQHILDTYQTQQELIQKQRDNASLDQKNAQNLRGIEEQSVNDTNAQIEHTQNLINDMIAELNTTPTDKPEYLTLKSSINQAQAGLNQLKNLQRTQQYDVSKDNPPSQVVDVQRDITQKQLDLQAKGLELSKEISRLQLSLAYVQESVMYPSTPCAGIVERLYVHPGETVNPGTLLATVTASTTSATVVVTVPEEVAKVISKGEPSELLIPKHVLALTPYYISSEPTEGHLYSVFYTIPDTVTGLVVNNDYVTINIPLTIPQTTAADPFIPVDAVYQTNDTSFVLVVINGKAVMKTVQLGSVFGSYVQVISGLKSADQVILDRSVIASDKVTI